jgi:hypothetical protein
MHSKVTELLLAITLLATIDISGQPRECHGDKIGPDATYMYFEPRTADERAARLILHNDCTYEWSETRGIFFADEDERDVIDFEGEVVPLSGRAFVDKLNGRLYLWFVDRKEKAVVMRPANAWDQLRSAFDFCPLWPICEE